MSLATKLFKGIKETISQTPQFQEFAQKIVNLQLMSDQTPKMKKIKLVNNIVEETINSPQVLEIDSFGNEMKKFLVNAKIFPNRTAEGLFYAPAKNKNYITPPPRFSESTYDLLKLHPRFTNRAGSNRFEGASIKERAARRIKKNTTDYMKEGGTRDKYLKIKEYMDQGLDLISATKEMKKDFNTSTEYSKFYSTNVNQLYKIGPKRFNKNYKKKNTGKNSVWLNNKDLMKKYDPELYNFFDNKINQYTTDLDKRRLEISGNLTENQKINSLVRQEKVNFLTKLKNQLEDLNIFPKRDYKQKDPPPNALDQEHIMSIGDRKKMYFDPRYKDYYEDRIARLYKKPSYLTTRERNESIKKKLANKIINSENIKKSIIKDFEAGDMNKQDFISEMSIQNSRINMLNSEMKDQGLELGLFDPVTKEETFYGGKYDSILDLVKSEKEGVVPLKSDVVGPPKKLKSVDEVEKLKNGGLLNIEEVLNSD